MIRVVNAQDFCAVLSSCRCLEVAVLNEQMALDDTVLTVASTAGNLRKFSVAACYAVSDDGVKSLSRCRSLRDVNLSYCYQVGDMGVAKLASSSLLHILTARGLPRLTDTGLVELVKVCTMLQELDISGCLLVSETSLYALQENLLHMRDRPDMSPEVKDRATTGPLFSITLGGTSIAGDVAMKFAVDTGAEVSLHDLSSTSLQQPHFDFALSHVEEDMLREDSFNDADLCDDSSRQDIVPEDQQRAYDWLEADDPALFSDEFSGPEEDGLF